MSAWSDWSTEALWEKRQNFLDAMERIGMMVITNTLPVDKKTGDAVCAGTTVTIQANQVEAIDAVLLSRGETVPTPWFLLDEDEM